MTYSDLISKKKEKVKNKNFGRVACCLAQFGNVLLGHYETTATNVQGLRRCFFAAGRNMTGRNVRHLLVSTALNVFL
jgi:hypothetical protein